ncbi:unnamed protein product [Fusarium venenatum]|uniref:Uncharacterized protein n=1 Tax=Fusarium venenatum TaxID=56646 RepID=A0A2L2TNS1_9HYPO|nr:uncharacterized protein FVRRES_06696 [Fusarium venenatum]CEI62260.1 unnamed protein product [Fusarium venenatum]
MLPNHRISSPTNYCFTPVQATFSSFLFSLALFAFWLRSSVVSVLFSLISERSLRRPTLIIPIFGSRVIPSVLAHGFTHCVPSITLPLGDANAHLFGLNLFIAYLGLPGLRRRGISALWIITILLASKR